MDKPHSKPLLLIAALLVINSAHVSARLPASVAPDPSNPYVICCAPGGPWDTCSLNSTSADPNALFTGYAPSLFRASALAAGLPKSDYIFKCMEWEAMLEDIDNPNGTCDGVSSGLPISQAHIKAGVQHVYSDWRTNPAVVTYSSSTIDGRWIFLKPFTWLVWVMLLAAAIVVGCSIHLVEVLSKQHTARQIEFEPYTIFGEHGWVDSIWQGLGLVVNAVDPFSAVTTASRIIVFVWSFLILLVLTMYTGNAAAIFTVNNYALKVKSRQDLPGAYWGAVSGTAAILPSLGLTPNVYFPWNNDDDLAVFVEALRSGAVDALVMDDALANNILAKECNFHQVDRAGGTSLAISFAPTVNSSLVTRFSLAVLELEQLGELDRLQTTFLRPATSCSQETSSTEPIGFSKLSGLWIVLAATIGICVLVAAVTNVINRNNLLTKRSKKRERDLVPDFEGQNAKHLSGA